MEPHATADSLPKVEEHRRKFVLELEDDLILPKSILILSGTTINGSSHRRTRSSLKSIIAKKKRMMSTPAPVTIMCTSTLTKLVSPFETVHAQLLLLWI